MSTDYDDALYTDDQLAERLAGDLWRQLWGYTRPYRAWVWGLCLCAVVVALMDVAFPLITREVVDDLTHGGLGADLTPWLWAYGTATVILAGAVGAFIFLGGRLRTHISHDIRRDAFNQLQDLSFAYFDRRPVGWLMARMTSDCERLSNILAWGLLDLAWGATVMSGALVAMLLMAPNLTVTVVAVVPLLALASLRFQQRILSTARDVRRYNAQLTANFNETVMGVQTTQAFQREADNHNRFRQLSDAMYGASVKNLLYGAIYLPVVLTLASLALGGALALGGLELFLGTLTAGTVLAFLTYARHFFEPVEQLAHWFAEMQMAQASAERVLSLVNAEPEIRDSEAVRAGDQNAALPPLERIEIRDLAFAYGSGPQVLRDIQLTLRRGTLTALIGPTGGGKSTLSALLCRFYEPTGGGIYVNGQEYRTLPLRVWQERLGVVLQTPHLFSGSIGDNLRFARPEASDADLWHALEKSQGAAFVRGLPEGLAFQVGEGGSRLSAGQRQLLSLTRVLLCDAELVILDEATATIDSETEALITQALKDILADRIAVIVAHRLSTIRHADQIAVLEGSTIVELGNHEQLLAEGGRYATLLAQGPTIPS
ncbi:MAG: ABC transporter ATP-binding protein [Pseudomonadales bacterium]|nr:ABC transporter ATP-binding protein [Pseudomonadales bacterium]